MTTELLDEEIARKDRPISRDHASITFRATDADAAIMSILEWAEQNSYRTLRYACDVEQGWGSLTLLRYDMPAIDPQSLCDDLYETIAEDGRKAISVKTIRGETYARGYPEPIANP